MTDAIYLTPEEEQAIRQAASVIDEHQRRKAAAMNQMPSFHAKETARYLEMYAQNNKQPGTE